MHHRPGLGAQLSEILLHEPYVVPLGTREVKGSFRAAADFRLKGHPVWTPQGMICLPPGSRHVTLEVELFGGPHLDPYSSDWTVSQVRGIHGELCDDIHVLDSTFRSLPREAMRFAGVHGLEVRGSHSDLCEIFLNLDYQVTVKPSETMTRANRGLHVHGFCTHRNGQGGTAPDPRWQSVLVPTRYVGGNGINVIALDGEISDFAAVGEYKGAIKMVSTERFQIRRAIGCQLMLQGSIKFDREKGGHHEGLIWPYGDRALDNLFEDCIVHPRLSLRRSFDDPMTGGQSLQFSWPQDGTKVQGCYFWPEPGPPGQLNLWIACQLAQDVEAIFTNNTFHDVDGPDDPNGLRIGPEYPEHPSSINADYKTTNQWVAKIV